MELSGKWAQVLGPCQRYSWTPTTWSLCWFWLSATPWWIDVHLVVCWLKIGYAVTLMAPFAQAPIRNKNIFEFWYRPSPPEPAGEGCIGLWFLLEWCILGVTCIHSIPFLCWGRNILCWWPYIWCQASGWCCWRGELGSCEVCSGCADFVRVADEVAAHC